MAPKHYKHSSRESKGVTTQSSSRSTASEFLINSLEDENVPLTEEEMAKAKQYDEHEASEASFPLNYIYRAQDYLNNTLNLRRFVQLCILVFIGNVYYFRNEETFWEIYSALTFNLLGVLIAITMSYTNSKSQFEKDPSRFPKPEYLEFNTIYAILLPTLLGCLGSRRLLLINLSLNYFLIDYINSTFKVLCSVAFYASFNDDLEVSFFEVPLIIANHYFIVNFLNYINIDIGKVIKGDNREHNKIDTIENNQKKKQAMSLSASEIHLISVLVIDMMYGMSENSPLPLLILQKLVRSLILTCAAVYPIFTYYKSNANVMFEVITAASFIASFYFLVNYQLSVTLKDSNALLWLLNYISESEKRIMLLKFWLSAVSACVPLSFAISKYVPLNYRRKFWHWFLFAMAVTPGLSDEPEFTAIALFGTSIILIIIEILRYNKFTFFGNYLYDQLKVFQDEKDLQGPLNLSYIFLIIGASLPIGLDLAIDGKITYKSYIGLISLGLGDSLASIVGMNFGTLKWKGSSKSVQGTLAFIVISFLGFYVVDSYMLKNSIQDWENVLVMCIIGGVLEGVSEMNDNFLVPIVMYTTTCVL